MSLECRIKFDAEAAVISYPADSSSLLAEHSPPRLAGRNIPLQRRRCHQEDIGALAGERTRIAIARMLVGPANLLLMDEPTNHLDIAPREDLTGALDAYRGTLCFITHDRTLILEIGNRIIKLQDGQVTVFAGSYNDYLWRSTCPNAQAETLQTRPCTGQLRQLPTAARKPQRKAFEAQVRNERHRAILPVRGRMAEIERETAATTARIREIEALMADPDHYRDSQNIIAVNREYVTPKENVARLIAEWEGLVSEAERIDLDYRYSFSASGYSYGSPADILRRPGRQQLYRNQVKQIRRRAEL